MSVNLVPTNCIPSPESPAKRIVTAGIDSTVLFSKFASTTSATGSSTTCSSKTSSSATGSSTTSSSTTSATGSSTTSSSTTSATGSSTTSSSTTGSSSTSATGSSSRTGSSIDTSLTGTPFISASACSTEIPSALARASADLSNKYSGIFKGFSSLIVLFYLISLTQAGTM